MALFGRFFKKAPSPAVSPDQPPQQPAATAGATVASRPRPAVGRGADAANAAVVADDVKDATTQASANADGRRRSERPTVVTGFGPKPPAPPPEDAAEEALPAVPDDVTSRPTVKAGKLEELVELATGKPVASRPTVVNTHVKQALKRAVDSEKNIAAISESPEALALAQLALAFPSLAGAPGTEPWDARKLVTWLNEPGRNQQAVWSGRFVLAVAEPETDWSGFGLRGTGRFDLFAALAVWDADHKASFGYWIRTVV